MISSVLFITTLIVAVVEAIKFVAPAVRGLITMVVAVLVGIVVALVDVHIGLDNISVAQGILAGLSAIGTVSIAQKVNTGTNTSVKS